MNGAPRGVKSSGKEGNKTVVTALYSAAVNKADDGAASAAAAVEDEVDVMDAADDAVLLEALSQWAPQDDSAPAEAVKKIR